MTRRDFSHYLSHLLPLGTAEDRPEKPVPETQHADDSGVIVVTARFVQHCYQAGIVERDAGSTGIDLAERALLGTDVDRDRPKV